jgi:hypothetical protein
MTETMSVTITREKLYPTPGRPARAPWKWCYSYSTEGAPPVEYGPGLSSLTDHLKYRARKAGKQLAITREWAR